MVTMSSQELVAFYAKRKETFSKQLAETTSQINVISNVRLVIAVIFIAFTFFGLRDDRAFLFTLPFLAVLFIYVVRKHALLFDAKTHLQNLVKINHEEERAINGDVSSRETGSEFVDPHHPYSHDLDIFGEGSLYQWTNRANTLIGRKKFSERLKVPLQSAEAIKANQEAVADLFDKTDFRQNFQAAGMEIDEKPQDREKLLAWLKHPSFLYGSKFYQYILIVLPLLTVGLLVAAFIDVRFRPFVILLAIFQWAFLGFHIKKSKRVS